MRATRGANGPVERAGGKARRQVNQALYGEAPFGIRESTCTARNRVDFYDEVDTGCPRRSALPDKRRKDLVSVGRDQLKGADSGAVREVHINFDFDSLYGTVERHFLLRSRVPASATVKNIAAVAP